MAFITKQQVQNVRELLKPIAKKYGVKLTVSGSNSSTLTVRLQEGKFDFAANPEYNVAPVTNEQRYNGCCISQWHYAHKFNEETVSFLDEVFNAMRSQGWYDRSDAMTDYFDTAYYMYVRIGAWNKPYRVIE